MPRVRRTSRPHSRLRRGTREDLRVCLLQFQPRNERELLRVRQPTHAREFRGQVPVLRDETLNFAIEEETNLAERLEVLFLRELYHPTRI